MPEINAPSVVAELAVLHDAYELALAANRVEELNGYFWNSPHTVRFGVNEHLYGAEAVAAYRQTSTPVFSERRLVRREILALGDATASIMCELSQVVLGQPRHVRQSQVWVRFPGLGWKIVAAHVSNSLTQPGGAVAWDNYVDHAASALRLPIDRAHRPGVIQNLQRTASLAEPLMAFELPEGAELAPTFKP
ncbi:MAG: DUF3225 domain-containing protein [Opitutaceae bacterium]|nr:DUF3225 domain-containing protein [Opitutaceae bacterium]